MSYFGTDIWTDSDAAIWLGHLEFNQCRRSDVVVREVTLRDVWRSKRLACNGFIEDVCSFYQAPEASANFSNSRLGNRNFHSKLIKLEGREIRVFRWRLLESAVGKKASRLVQGHHSHLDKDLYHNALDSRIQERNRDTMWRYTTRGAHQSFLWVSITTLFEFFAIIS